MVCECIHKLVNGLPQRPNIPHLYNIAQRTLDTDMKKLSQSSESVIVNHKQKNWNYNEGTYTYYFQYQENC